MIKDPETNFMGFTDKESIKSHFSAANGYDCRMRFRILPLMFRTTYGNYSKTMKGMLSGFRDCLVLDIACGTGFCGTFLAPSNSYSGLDLSPAMLGEARKKLILTGMPFAPLQGDALALPFMSGTFDLVISSLGLHFMPDMKSAISEAGRVMKPGAVFACCSPVMESGFFSDRYWQYHHKKGRFNAPIFECDIIDACDASGLDYRFYAKKGRLLYFTAEKR